MAASMSVIETSAGVREVLVENDRVVGAVLDDGGVVVPRQQEAAAVQRLAQATAVDHVGA